MVTRYNRLIVIKEPYIKQDNKKRNIKFVICRCDCGKEKEYRLNSLQTNNTKSCGCLKKENQLNNKYNIKHNLTNHKLYDIWKSMKYRCYKQTDLAFHNYGERNISVCQEWLDDFINFYNWATTNGWKENLEIDRKNTNGNYEPDNCRFITSKENCNNKRNNKILTIFNESKSLSLWSEDLRCKVSRTTLSHRIHNNWDHEKAILTPPLKVYK